MADNNELQVIIKAKELSKHTLVITSNANRYPKKYRFSLVDKMQNKNLMKSIWHGKIMRHTEIALNYVEAWTNILRNY